jgi:hypothetical protein|tara:strand:- start:678 stop:3107 length:2430 start_codon:yes stop_codon:yes gene_type:complete
MADDKTTKDSASTMEQSSALQQQMNENLRIAEEYRIRENELLKEKMEIVGKTFASAKAQIETDKTILKGLSAQARIMANTKSDAEDVIKARAELNRLMSEAVPKMKMLSEAEARRKKIINEYNETLKDSTKSLEDVQAASKKAAVEMERLRAEIDDSAKGADKISKGIDGFASKMGFTADLSNTMSGNFAEMGAELSTGLSGDKLALVVKNMKDLGAGMIFSVVDQIGKLAIAISDAGKAFQAANGFSQNFSETMGDLHANTYMANVSMQENQAAMQGLADSFSSFNPNAKQANVHMATNIGLLSKFGVSAGTGAKLTQQLSKQFQISGEAAADMMVKTVRAGKNIGISTKKMADDLAANFDKLSQFGDDLIDVFHGLEAQSKQTGVEMGRLVDIASQFDTFEGAAKKSQQLNAMLGTNLSTIELMNADYDETISLIRDGMSGIDFSNLNRFEKLYITQAMGAKSVAEAQMLLTGEQDEYLAKMQAVEETQQELQKAAMEVIPLMQRLGMVLLKIAMAAKPLMDGILAAVEGMMMLDDKTGGFLGTAIVLLPLLIAIGVAFKTAFVAAATVFAPMWAIVGGLVLVISGVGKAMDYWIEKIDNITPLLFTVMKAIKWIAGGIALLVAFKVGVIAAPIAAAAGAVMLIVGAFEAVYNLFKKKVNPPFINAFSWMATGVELLGLAFKVMMAPFNAIIGMFRMAFEAAKPFVGLLNQVGGYLGFDINTGEEPTATPPDATKAAGTSTNAAIAAASAEIRTIVVAQLKETGIKEIAEGLTILAKEIRDQSKDTNVSVVLDGREISSYVKKGMLP